MAADPHDLARFVAAQEPVYEQVRTELAAGRKTSHWMWFVFPQAAGLGSSAMAQRYAIGSLEEARAYLAHPVLGARLGECAGLMMRHAGRSAHDILGSPDDMKLHACATLFDRAGGNGFAEILDRFYAGRPHEATLRLLGDAQPSKT
jgi:uncharacterized protein (DUF1810 family)